MTGETQHLTTTFHKNVAHTCMTIMQKKVAKYCNTSISSQNFFMFRANNLEITVKNLLMTINSGNFQFRQNIQNAVKPVLSGHP